MTRKLRIIITAPLEIVGVTAVFAWRGFKMGCENVRDAWRGDLDFKPR